MDGNRTQPQQTAVILTLPEAFRSHPAFESAQRSTFLESVLREAKLDFRPDSIQIEGGAAATIKALRLAAELLHRPGITQVIVGGVDSLVNGYDFTRLGEAKRLKTDQNAQGLVPGEGAAFVCFGLESQPDDRYRACVHNVALFVERNSALTTRYSQGAAMLDALKAASGEAGLSEPQIEFIVSNSNGERYAALESLVFRSRFYRTRREILPTAYPAMTVGDIGAASGALALLVAADSFGKGYAPGSVAMVEVSSEEGARAAALVSQAR